MDINFENIENEDIELEDYLNEAFSKIDSMLKEVCLNEEFSNHAVEYLMSSNYNKMTPKQRRKVLAAINNYFAQVIVGDILQPSLYVYGTELDEDVIEINDDGIVSVYDKAFKVKDAGFNILGAYIFQLRKYLVKRLTNMGYEYCAHRDKLKGLAKIYYENMDESILGGVWENFLSLDDDNYYYQPIIYDSNMFTIDIMYEYVKLLYKKQGFIDKGMSEFLYNRYIRIKCNDKQFSKKRKNIIKLNRENSNKYGSEKKCANEYLKRTMMDFSTFSDDEFYELFTSTYAILLQYDSDGLLSQRLTNIANELIHRIFNEFDTTDIVFPKYKVEANSENLVKKITIDYDGEIEVVESMDTASLFAIVLSDVSMVAQKNKLFKYNDEREKQDLEEMLLWCDIKNHDYSNPEDEKLVKNELNIIIQKVRELLSEVQHKVESAISKSNFLPRGRTVLTNDNKEAFFDYHEFKNGLSKEEVKEMLQEKIRKDIAEIQGGR